MSMPQNVRPAPIFNEVAADPVQSLSSREIFVTLGDEKLPFAVFLGPANSGKTMGTLRLSKFIRDEGGQVIVDRQFRSDDYYRQTLCREFSKQLSQPHPEHPDNTPDCDFIALDILEKNSRNGGYGGSFKILELPGEHVFRVDRLAAEQDGYHPYLKQIFNCRAPKIVVFFMPVPNPELNEAGALEEHEFEQYCLHIENLILHELDVKRDSFIFAVSKCDQHKGKMINSTTPNKSAFRRALLGRPGFKKIENALRKSRHGVIVVPFSAGTITPTVAGKKGYLQFGKDVYPAALMREIKAAIRGRSFWEVIMRILGR